MARKPGITKNPKGPKHNVWGEVALNAYIRGSVADARKTEEILRGKRTHNDRGAVIIHHRELRSSYEMADAKFIDLGATHLVSAVHGTHGGNPGNTQSDSGLRGGEFGVRTRKRLRDANIVLIEMVVGGHRTAPNHCPVTDCRWCAYGRYLEEVLNRKCPWCVFEAEVLAWERSLIDAVTPAAMPQVCR